MITEAQLQEAIEAYREMTRTAARLLEAIKQASPLKRTMDVFLMDMLGDGYAHSVKHIKAAAEREDFKWDSLQSRASILCVKEGRRWRLKPEYMERAKSITTRSHINATPSSAEGEPIRDPTKPPFDGGYNYREDGSEIDESTPATRKQFWDEIADIDEIKFPDLMKKAEAFRYDWRVVKPIMLKHFKLENMLYTRTRKADNSVALEFPTESSDMRKLRRRLPNID